MFRIDPSIVSNLPVAVGTMLSFGRDAKAESCNKFHCSETRFAKQGKAILFCLLRILLVVLIGLYLDIDGVSQQTSVAQLSSLVSGQKIEANLAGGQTKIYNITLQKGWYLSVLVEQNNVDVAVALWSQNGTQVLKVDLFGTVGPEPLSHVATEDGVFRLAVHANQTQRKGGRYSITTQVKNKPTPADETKIVGERSLASASELVNGGVADLRKALELTQKSTEQWRLLHDHYWEAYSLNQIGNIYVGLGELSKGAEYLNQALFIRRRIGDALGEARTLYAFGRLNQAKNENGVANDYFKRALLLFRAIDDRAAVAYTLVDIGRAYEDVGDHREAFRYYWRALRLSRVNQYIRQEAVALTDIGTLHTVLKQTSKALQFYELALPVWRAAKDREGEAITLAKIGYEYSVNGNQQQALAYYRRALVIYKATKSKERESETLKYIADAYLALGDRRKAIETYTQSAHIEHSLGNQRAEAEVFQTLSTIHNDAENYEEVLRYSLLALQHWRSLGDRQSEAAALDKIATALSSLERNDEALQYYQHALPIWRQLKNRQQQADTLRYIGGLYFVRDKRLALEPLMEAQVLYHSLGDQANAATTLTMIGLDYYLLGEKQRAWNYFESGLDYLRYSDVGAQESNILINLPMLMVLFEDNQTALNYLQRVKVVSTEFRRQRVKAVALTNIGKIHYVMENSPAALSALQEALSIFRTINDRNGEAWTLNEIGKVYLGWRDPSSSPNDSKVTPESANATLQYLNARLAQLRENAKRANGFFQRGLNIFRELQNHAGESACLTGSGKVHQILDNDQEAFNDFSKAFLLVEKFPDSGDQTYVLYSLMDVSRDLSNIELAIVFGKQVVNQLQSMRSKMKILDKNLERAFVRLTTDPYRELASLLISQGRLLEAEQVVEMLKEEEYFRFVRRDDHVASELLKRLNLSPAERSALEEYSKIAEKIVALGEEYARLDEQKRKLPPKQTAAIIARQEELNKDLLVARRALSVFLDALKKEFGEEDKRIAGIEEGLQAAVKRWAQPHTVVVSTIVGKDRLSMVLTTPETQRAFMVDKISGAQFTEEGLNILINEFRTAMKDPREDPRPSGQKLYDILIKPLAKDLAAVNADTIVWSLDANLRYIPMAALYDSQHGFLAERYANVMITLASRNNLDAQPTDQGKWQALGLGVSKPVGGFPPLENVPDELRAIIRDEEQREQTGLLRGHRLLDEQFTMAAFRLHLGHYNVIHAATHFSFKTGTREEALESFLLLGSGERLTLAQVKDGGTIFTGVELLVLSACDTAAGGKGADGREVEGFGVLAQRAGARAVLATLWPVADPSTRELMVKFYEMHAANPGTTKAEALRRAQIALLNGRADSAVATTEAGDRAGQRPSPSSSRYAHPYYWAPFILIGNWK